MQILISSKPRRTNSSLIKVNTLRRVNQPCWLQMTQAYFNIFGSLTSSALSLWPWIWTRIAARLGLGPLAGTRQWGEHVVSISLKSATGKFYTRASRSSEKLCMSRLGQLSFTPSAPSQMVRVSCSCPSMPSSWSRIRLPPISKFMSSDLTMELAVRACSLTIVPMSGVCVTPS